MKFPKLTSLLIAICICSGCALLPPQNHTPHVSNRCEVHEIEMERTVVPIMYGLPAIPLDQEYLNALAEATRQSFPHAQESVPGGCIIRFGASKRAAIYVCDDCRSAKRDWMSRHKPNPKPNQSVQPSADNALSLPMKSLVCVIPGSALADAFR